MTVRWALGLPLGLAGIVGVPVGLLIFGGLLPAEPGLERYRLVFCLLWTGLAAGIWLRSWQQPRYWPVWALTSSFTTASLVALGGAGLPALLGPLVAVLLSWAGRRVLLRPIGVDLAASRLEIPVRGGNFRLFVQRDRLLLKMTTGAGVVPQAMPLRELTLAQPGQFAGNEVRWWPLPGSQWTRMGRGPVLRLVSGRQQWLLPVDAPRELAVIIRARATTARRPADRTLTLDQWHTLHSWASRQLTTSGGGGGGFAQRTVGWRLIVALPAALLGSSVLGESIARGGAFLSGGLPVVGLVELAIAVVLAADWARVRGRLRVAADNALPPGSPAWGELRSDHAPLAGWQPWWETYRS
jgi:hypothetical protein